MMRAAAGSANRLAGTDATGRPPARAITKGATATWAAKVTANGSATNRGRGRNCAKGRASITMPADAATESWNPNTPTSNGSISSTTVTASPSRRTPDEGRPSDHAVTARAAMNVARSTDGSKRVIRAKNPSSPTVNSQRNRGPSRRSAGATTAITNATFSPETTSR